MEIIKLIQSISNPFFDMLFQGITMLGEDNFFMLATAVVYWCVSKEWGYRLGFICLTSAAVNQALKDIFRVPRVIGEEGIRSLRLHTAGGFSFPSGHTQSTASFWTLIMLHFRKQRLYVTGAAIILLVGFSRLYLGVHRPVDILGGIAVGWGWVIIWNYLDRVAGIKGKAIYLLFIIPVLTGMWLFSNNQDYYKVAGGLLGLYLGYIIEPRYIRFRVEARWELQVIKLALGLTTLLAIRMALKHVLPDVPMSHFVRYFVLVIWMTIVMPVLYTALSRRFDRKSRNEEHIHL